MHAQDPHDRSSFFTDLHTELILRVSQSKTVVTLLVLALTLSCGGGESAGPTTAAIAVIVSTRGLAADLDPDGYFLSVDGGPHQIVGVNTSLTISALTTGKHLVRLEDIAANCAVVGGNTKSVDVGGASVAVAFTVLCAPRTGSVQVKITTSGVQPDRDGYYVALAQVGGPFYKGAPSTANGILIVPGLVVGTYRMTVYGIAANCDAVGLNPRTVAVEETSPAAITLDVTCEASTQIALVYGNGTNADIYLVNSDGSGRTPLVTSVGADEDPAWSPDGRKIVFTSQRDGNSEIYVMNADGSSQVRLTTATGADSRPAWSPDGARIAFSSERDGNAEIYVMNTDGTNPVRLTSDNAYDSEPAWSPDGSKLAFRSSRAGSNAIWVMNADGSRPTRLTTNSLGDLQPAWSPDGSRIAFARTVSLNTRDIFVMNVDGSGITRITEGNDDSTDPAWSPNGRKISLASSSFYYSSEVYVVSLSGVPYAPVSPAPPTFNAAWRP